MGWDIFQLEKTARSKHMVACLLLLGIHFGAIILLLLSRFSQGIFQNTKNQCFPFILVK